MSVFDQMLSAYSAANQRDYSNAVHEVMQQIALAGLYRGGFFEKAAFYGGTCLRIFYGTERFSEDMDFSLLVPDEHFTLEPYFPAVIREFEAVGRSVEISRRQKSRKTAIESAFLKDESPAWTMALGSDRKIKIKIEVDTAPPGGFSTNRQLLMMPFSFYVGCYALPDLYAGKMHALLFRSRKSREKGRDWYDFEWYVRNNTEMNFNHFNTRAIQSGHLSAPMSKGQLLELLRKKILSLEMSQVIADVKPFLRQTDSLKIWSHDYFLDLAERMKLSE
jgi:predicted nucleotidyltransferase component of viral defense system